MNNQRRHELEQNVLASFLGAHLSKLQNLVKPLLLLAGAGAVLFLGYSVYQTFASKQSAKAWTEFYFNINGEADSFADLANDFRGSSAGQWAEHAAAVGRLQDGIDALYVNRQEGVDSIRKAISGFESIQNSSIVELKRLAQQGLARAHESLGELDQAIKYYQTLLDSSGTSEAEQEQVAQRISYLQTEEAQGFYDWFAKLNPKLTAPPELKGDLSDPPESPSISFDPANMPALPATPADVPVQPEIDLELPTVESPVLPEVNPASAPDPASVSNPSGNTTELQAPPEAAPVK